MHGVTLLIDRILGAKGLSVRFQPVVEITGGGVRLHMLECLTRGPCDSNAAQADVMFDYVRRKRAESVVDRACIRAALLEASRLPGAPRLSLNVHASTLGRDHGFPAFLAGVAEECGVQPSQLTIEIVEHSRYADGVTFDRALRELRALGARIALDDVGAGHSNYRMMLEVRAEYLKIDRYFVHGAHVDLRRRSVLDSVAQLGMKLGSCVVGEGVEDSADLAALRELGIDLAQGHLLAAALTAEQLIDSGWLDGRPREPQARPPQTAA